MLERISVVFFKKVRLSERGSFYSPEWMHHQDLFSSEGLLASEKIEGNMCVCVCVCVCCRIDAVASTSSFST